MPQSITKGVRAQPSRGARGGVGCGALEPMGSRGGAVDRAGSARSARAAGRGRGARPPRSRSIVVGHPVLGRPERG
jgi:hypothetical protein